MAQVYVIIEDGLVVECISVNSIDDLVEIYAGQQIIARSGDETVGWTYDGVRFTAPVGV